MGTVSAIIARIFPRPDPAPTLDDLPDAARTFATALAIAEGMDHASPRGVGAAIGNALYRAIGPVAFELLDAAAETARNAHTEKNRWQE